MYLPVLGGLQFQEATLGARRLIPPLTECKQYANGMQISSVLLGDPAWPGAGVGCPASGSAQAAGGQGCGGQGRKQKAWTHQPSTENSTARHSHRVSVAQNINTSSQRRKLTFIVSNVGVCPRHFPSLLPLFSPPFLPSSLPPALPEYPCRPWVQSPPMALGLRRERQTRSDVPSRS